MMNPTRSLFTGQQKTWALSLPSTITEDPRLNHIPVLIKHLLQQRDIVGSEDVRTFMEMSPSLFNDPFELPDMDIAVDRLSSAARNSERAAVYGDFDADGVTGAALMAKALEKKGVPLITYLPHRVREGHGLNQAAIDALRSDGTSVIVTVDCGVTDVESVRYANSLGIDVIITDHHVVGPIEPPALAVINPGAMNSQYRFGHLTGVGMALKLSQALLDDGIHDSWADGLMELAAIGTITDMAPLIGENRYIVGHGLRQLRKTDSIGLRELLREAKVDVQNTTAETIGFTIGPRLNAAGRLGHAKSAYNLLMTSDQRIAATLALELTTQNTLRREMTNRVLDECRETLAISSYIPPVIVIGSKSYHPGVCGLVAGRLVEEFGVPAVVYSIKDNEILASCRGTAPFHWAHALESSADLLNRHGGHARAAGFTCDEKNLGQLTLKLQSIAAENELGTGGPLPSTIHAEVVLQDLMGNTKTVLDKMEPFGIGNPLPIFITRSIFVEGVQTMGKNKEHLRIKLRDHGVLWDAIAFRQRWVPGTIKIDAIYSLTVDRWNGADRLRLLIHDFIPVGP